jgi:[protein-PII] uridylyltransferase
VRLLDDASDSATVVEVHAADGLGVLHRITAALTRAGPGRADRPHLDARADVVDAFYVVGADGGKVTEPDLRARLERDLLLALGG